MLRQDTEILPLVLLSPSHTLYFFLSRFFNLLLLRSPTFLLLIPLITDITSAVYYKKRTTCDSRTHPGSKANNLNDKQWFLT